MTTARDVEVARELAAKGHLPLSIAPSYPVSAAFQGIVQSDPAAEFFQQAMLKELKGINERLGIMTGERQKPGTTTGAARALEIEPTGMVAPPSGRIPSPAHEGEVVRTHEMARGELPAPAQLQDVARTANYFGRRDPSAAFGGFSLANLRQDVGEWAQRRLAEADWGTAPPSVQRDAQGRWRNMEGQFVSPDSAEVQDAMARVTQDEQGRWRDASGRFVSPTSPVVQTMLRKESVLQAARGASQVVAQGGSLGQAGIGALASAPGGMALLRGAGVAGAVIHGIDALGGLAERQRAENASWQRIMGGTNIEGFEERARQNIFGFSQFGFMDATQAEQLYRGVAETGMRGMDRTRAQDFALGAYRDFGMTVEQSLDIIRTAAKTGQESLIGVASALERVTVSAREAGVNTEVARKAFVESWKSMSEVVGGPAAVTTAAGITAAFTGLGREFQGVSGQIGMEQINIIASQQGMTANEYLMTTSGPNDPRILQDYTRVIQRQTGFGLRPEAAGALEPFRTKIAQGGVEGLTPEDREQLRMIGLQFGQHPTAMMMALQPYGIQDLNEFNAPMFYALVMSGAWNPAQSMQEEIARGATRQIETGVPLGEVSRSTQASGLMSEEFRQLETRVMGSSSGGMFNFTDDAIRQYFLEDVLRTGRAGGISEMLATSASVRGGIQKVRVTDENGKQREVSLKEAMRSYRDQLDAGTAIVVGEEGEMGTISEVTGMVGDTALGGAAEAMPQGSVMFDATPYLKSLIRPTTTTGNVFPDPAAGWEPMPSQVRAEDRATGNG